MISANFDEARQSQIAFVELLINLGYKYISCEEVMRQRSNDTSKFLLKEIAFKKLREINSFEYKNEIHNFSDKNISEAIDELENIQLEGLLDTSREIYNTIMSTAGKTIKEFINGKNESFNFKFIDFENIENNDFHVTVEFEASGKSNIRTDIVCFVNGIPFVVIENKKSSIEVKEALTQLNKYQTPDFCPKLFVYPQLLIGTNGKDLRYGTTATPNKFYVNWKEKESKSVETNCNLSLRIEKLIQKPIETEIYKQVCADLNGATFNHKQITERMTTAQDQGVICLLEPKRLLNLTKNFILYDAGTKKVSRYQQFFAIHKMLERIKEEEETTTGIKRKGGVVWHTQGSGKSLTMVMFVKALIENPEIINPRVIIVTDRKDLDKQISKTFRDCNLKKKVYVATSGKDLLKQIKEKNPAVVTTLVQKFESAVKHRANFIDDSKNIFVLIDEAHRTQGGLANAEMNRTIPNACFIAFTGTPLMKKEKSTYQKFGGYIDKYTIDDALEDGVILPLIYEGRYVELTQNRAKIDQHVERITQDFTFEQKKELQKFVNTKVIKSNPHRIGEIAYDIEDHYLKYFQGTGLKAQIVAPSKFSAILFQRFFEESGKINTAVIISETITAEDETDSHKKEVGVFLKKITDKYKNLKSYEDQIVDSFKNNPDGVEIIIVVDKLLTGFDAPRNTVLYLAKDLKDHNLLQAIARVNRLYENKKNPKTSGFIIDYSENARNIDTAMRLFGNFDEEDMKNSLIDVNDKIHDLEKSYSDLQDLFKELKNSKDDEAYITSLEDEQKRDLFYKSINEFLKNLNECLALQDFVHQFKHLDTYKRDLYKFIELRKSVRLRYADTKDFSEYKEQLVKILDEYIDAEAVEVLTQPININDADAFAQAIESLGSDKSKAEAIAAQMEKTITEKVNTDPEFYQRFSDKIKELLKKMKEGKMDDLKGLNEMKKIRAQMIGKIDETLPEEVQTENGADIFYRNLYAVFAKYNLSQEEIIQIILDIFKILKTETIVDWHKNSEVKRVISNKIDDYLYDEIKMGKNIDLSPDDIKKLLDDLLELAIQNHKIFV